MWTNSVKVKKQLSWRFSKKSSFLFKKNCFKFPVVESSTWTRSYADGPPLNASADHCLVRYVADIPCVYSQSLSVSLESVSLANKNTTNVKKLVFGRCATRLS